jgi:antitoxin component of MazEF toxin-antitoxin module
VVIGEHIVRSAKLTRIGGSVALVLPESAWRAAGLLAGTAVRLIFMKGEVRIRHCTSPRAYDLESLDDYRERQSLQEAERNRREDDDLSLRD